MECVGGEERGESESRKRQVTFNFSISGLLASADVDHQEAFGSLIEANDKVIKLLFGRGKADSSKGFEEATFVIK